MSVQQKQLDMQQIIQQLLASGLSYLQVWAKINACKQIFKKGTPEFYACLGVPPPQQHTPPPKPQQQVSPSKPQQPTSPPKPQQGTTIIVQRGREVGKWILIAAVIAATVFILRDARKRYYKIKEKEERE